MPSCLNELPFNVRVIAALAHIIFQQFLYVLMTTDVYDAAQPSWVYSTVLERIWLTVTQDSGLTMWSRLWNSEPDLYRYSTAWSIMGVCSTIYTFTFLSFADDVVVLPSLFCELQHWAGLCSPVLGNWLPQVEGFCITMSPSWVMEMKSATVTDIMCG